jgi:hypothetical protein
LFTGLLVVAAFVTAGVIFWQSWETRKSAEATGKSASAMEKSVTLQEVALRQWLAIENWQAMPYINTSRATMLYVQFEVINPTKFPLTLISISTKIGGDGTDSADKNLLPPDHRYMAAAYVGVTEEQMQKRQETTLVLPIAISITYVDILGEKREHPKNGMLAFTKTSTSFFTFRGPGIYMDGKKQQ